MKLTSIIVVLGLLTTVVKATLTRTPVDQGVLVNGSIRLNCSSNANPIQWTKGASTLIFNGVSLLVNTFQLDTTSYYDIYATNVDASFADTYTCAESASVTASANVVVFVSRPSCTGTTNGSSVTLTCTVAYSGSGVQLNIQQNGQFIANGTVNVKTLSWSGPLTDTNNLICTAYSGISSQCTITNELLPTTTTRSLVTSSSAPTVTSASSTNTTVPTSESTMSTTTIIIIVCCIGGGVLIAVIVVIAYFTCRRSTNPPSVAEPKADLYPTGFVGMAHHTEVGSRMTNNGTHFQHAQFHNSAHLNSGYQGYEHGDQGNVARATNYHYSPSHNGTDQHVAKAYNRSLY